MGLKKSKTAKSENGSRFAKIKDFLGFGSRTSDVPDDGNIGIYISPVTFIMAIVLVVLGRTYEFACSLAAVVLHELAHARVAKKLGYALNEIRIMPYGAALCGSADIMPKHEILIAIAGPLFNLVLGVIFAALWWLIPTSYAFTQQFCLCNLYIGIFNLLPVYPLDGGRVMFACLTAKMRRKRAYLIMRIISAVIGLIALALFAVSAVFAPNITFLTIGIFMVASALIPDNRARYYSLFALGGRRGRISRPLEVRTFAVSDGAKLSQLYAALDPDKFCVFEVYDSALEKKCKLTEGELTELVKSCGYDSTVAAALEAKKNNRRS